MDNNKITSNEAIINDTIKKIGKRRVGLNDKEISQLADSKQFDLVDYFKKIMIANEVLKLDSDLNLEYGMKDEYESLLKERLEFEESGQDLTKNKKYQNMKTKTEHGLSFFIMQNYFSSKKLNQIANDHSEIAYKIEANIEKRSRRSPHFKTDRKRAVANATVNLFREQFPKSKDTLTTNTLFLDDSSIGMSKIAAKTVSNLCENGVLSDFVLKISTRLDQFSEMTGMKNIFSNVFKHAGTAMKYAASAAVIAIVGTEGMDLLNTPMPPIADLGIKETLDVLVMTGDTLKDTLTSDLNIGEQATQILADIDVSTVEQTLDVSDSLNGVDVESLKTPVVEGEDQIMEFLNKSQEAQNIHEAVSGETLTEIATNHLGNPTTEELQHFISAMSEFNDLDNPNEILSGQDVQIPNEVFVENFDSSTFQIDFSNKKEIMESMKNVTIEYGETKSQLIEKLVEGAKESNQFKASQLSNFESTLKDVIPTDLKAFDKEVTNSIKESVNNLDKLKQTSSFKLR